MNLHTPAHHPIFDLAMASQRESLPAHWTTFIESCQHHRSERNTRPEAARRAANFVNLVFGPGTGDACKKYYETSGMVIL